MVEIWFEWNGDGEMQRAHAPNDELNGWQWIQLSSVCSWGAVDRKTCNIPHLFALAQFNFRFVLVFTWLMNYLVTRTYTNTHVLGQKLINYDGNLWGVKKPCQCKLFAINSNEKCFTIETNPQFRFRSISSDLSMSVHFYVDIQFIYILNKCEFNWNCQKYERWDLCMYTMCISPNSTC